MVVDRDGLGDLTLYRQRSWRSLREARARWVVAASGTLLFALLAFYVSEQASFFSQSGKIWAIVSFVSLILSFVLGALAAGAIGRVRMAANGDGVFMLEALGLHGHEVGSKVGQEVHDLLWSVALYLKDGRAVPDGIRSEAIRVAEQALGRQADMTYKRRA